MKTAIFLLLTLVVCSMARRTQEKKDPFAQSNENDSTVTAKKESGGDPAKR